MLITEITHALHCCLCSQARMLVTELNLLQVILDTFLEHCKPKLNRECQRLLSHLSP